MRRVHSHLWPVVHYRPPRSPLRLRDGMAPLCHRAATVTDKSDRAPADRPLPDPMIRAMTDMSSHPPADGSSPVPGYRSVYPSAYTPVHNQKQEVS